jgi:kynurenine formamidase
VANIERISVHQGFTVMVAPPWRVGETGSPVRVLALWEAAS